MKKQKIVELLNNLDEPIYSTWDVVAAQALTVILFIISMIQKI